MPEKCVAKFCSNKPQKFITLHKFPESEKVKKLWRNFVKTKRANWTETPTSVLCSVHFTQDCFVNYYAVREDYQRRLSLKPDAVPTIHAKDPQKKDEVNTKQQKIPASVRKRDVIAVSVLYLY